MNSINKTNLSQNWGKRFLSTFIISDAPGLAVGIILYFLGNSWKNIIGIPLISASIGICTLSMFFLFNRFLNKIKNAIIRFFADGHLLFAMPNQVFIPPSKTDNLHYFKVLFDENTLALLPQQFPFLVNPLNTQTIVFDKATRARLRKVFEILNQILHIDEHPTDIEIVLSYLNSLLTELNSAYFKNTAPTNILNTNLSKFIEFKLVVETHLTEQPSVNAIAEKLALTTNSLYRIVKEYAGVSPKDFFTNRLIIEAQRKLQYSSLSVKELAYELGFNDPDYFSRFFKKCTGKSVSEFLEAPQDSSRQ